MQKYRPDRPDHRIAEAAWRKRLLVR